MTINTIAELNKTVGSNTDFLGSSAGGTANANDIDVNRQSFAAIIARAYDDMGGVVTVGGSGNAITVTSNSTYSTLRTGLQITIKAVADNTGATTLNLDGNGAKAVRLPGDVALSGGEIRDKGYYLLTYDSAYNSPAGAWVLQNQEGVNQAPIILKQSTSAAPTVEGDIQWDTDDNRLKIGDGSGTKTFYPDVMADSTPGAAQAATQSDQETATSTTRVVTPARQQYHPSAGKCWAYVTVSGGTPSLAAGYNITSITDVGTGRLTITIGTDFSSANWASLVTLEASPVSDYFPLVTAKAAGTISISMVRANASVNADPDAWNFLGLGDQ
jgi:hypothetical protein